MNRPKRPRDPNELANTIVGLATGMMAESVTRFVKDPAAVSLGRKGGLKGGKARARALSKARRSAIARKAARARWKKRK